MSGSLATARRACGGFAGVALAACSVSEPVVSDEAWVGSVTVSGNLTRTINESGSLWGGPGRLVEEASIGVPEGEDPYMLGAVGAVWATDTEIYVVDSQAPAVRVYDWQGVCRTRLCSATMTFLTRSRSIA